MCKVVRWGLSWAVVVTIVCYSCGFAAADRAAAASVSTVDSEKNLDGTRVVMLTSGPVNFKSYCLDNPFRVVIEFQSGQLAAKMDREILVNQGALKKINTVYLKKNEKRLLNSVTFELAAKVPYRVWQEQNAVIVDIDTPADSSVFYLSNKELFTQRETMEVIAGRIASMDAQLAAVSAAQEPVLLAQERAAAMEAALNEVIKGEGKDALPRKASMPVARLMTGKTYSMSIGAVLLKTAVWLWSGVVYLGLLLGFLLWRRRQPNLGKRLKELKIALRPQAAEIAQTAEADMSEPDSLLERRCAGRLPLTQDFRRTVVMKVQAQDMRRPLRFFAQDIAPNGLGFASSRDFAPKAPLKLTLIFYGGYISTMEMAAEVVWKKANGQGHHYGVSFTEVKGKDSLELNRFITSNIAQPQVDI